MSGCGLGFTSNVIENLLLYALAQNRVLIEVPVNSSWYNVRGKKAFNEGRTPALTPRWCDDGPATHQCYYSRLTHCKVPPVHTHTAPHLGHGASIRNSNQINAEAHALRFKLTWFFKTPRVGLYASAAKREAARFLWRPRAWVRRIGDCVMRQHDLQPRRDTQPANFVSIFIRESAEKDRELRRYHHGLVPRAVWPNVSQRVAAQLGVRRVFLQTSSASAAIAYSSAATSLGLTVSYTENRRSEHDEWGGWSNGTNAIILQGTVAAVNLYIASQAAALASPSMTSWTRFLEAGMPPSDPEIVPPPPLQLLLCCRCTRHDGGAGDLTVLVPRQGHKDVQAQATLDALKSKTWMPCTLRHPRPPLKPQANATAAPEALTATSSAPGASIAAATPRSRRRRLASASHSGTGCAIWIDRPMPRTATRSVQQVMSSLATHHGWLYRQRLLLGGAEAQPHSASQLDVLLKASAVPCPAALPPLRLAMQIASAEPLEAIIASLMVLRNAPAACCTAVATVRVREPLHYYLSVFQATFFAEPPHIGHQCQSGRCHLKPVWVSKRMRGIVPAIQGPVSSFEAWAPADLQSRQLLYGTRGYARLPAMDEGNFSLLLRLLDEGVVAYSVDDEFAEGLQRLTGKLGAAVPMPPAGEPRTNPRQGFFGGGPSSDAEYARELNLACPLGLVSCAALVQQRAPYDARLYAHVAGRAPMVSARLVRLAATAPTKANSTAIVERSLANFQPRVAEEALSVDTTDGERPLSICRQLPFSMATALHGSALGRSLAALDEGAKNSSDGCVPPEAAPLAPGERQPPQQNCHLLQVNGCGSLPASLAAFAAQLRNIATACDEVRVVAWFGAPPHKRWRFQKKWHTPEAWRLNLPRAPAGPENRSCNIAVGSWDGLSQNQREFEEKRGWILHDTSPWPFPGDAPRSAHVVKTFAPYLFPRAQRILYGDAKCNRLGWLPCNALRSPQLSGDLVAVQHPAWSHRSVEGEFVLTWSRLQERRSRSRAYRELSAQLGRYEREPYPALRAVGVLADTFCLGWRRTALTLEHSCHWTREVALQMREQCSFDHSIPAGLKLAWIPYW